MNIGRVPDLQQRDKNRAGIIFYEMVIAVSIINWECKIRGNLTVKEHVDRPRKMVVWKIKTRQHTLTHKSISTSHH